MNLHLAEIATEMTPGARAVLLLDLGATLALSRSRMAHIEPFHRAAKHNAPAAAAEMSLDP